MQVLMYQIDSAALSKVAGLLWTLGPARRWLQPRVLLGLYDPQLDVMRVAAAHPDVDVWLRYDAVPPRLDRVLAGPALFGHGHL